MTGMERTEIEITGGAGEIATAPAGSDQDRRRDRVLGRRDPRSRRPIAGVADQGRRRRGPASTRTSMPEERSYDPATLWWSLLTVLGGSGARAVGGPGGVSRAGRDARGAGRADRDLHGDPRARRRAARGPARLDPGADPPDWVCVISDDCSSPEAFDVLERTSGDDPRFVVSRAPERLGFLRNFERAMRSRRVGAADRARRPGRPLAPRQARVSASALEAPPASLLAYSDVRIADEDGTVLSDTYFFERRNNSESMASMLITNNVTGAAVDVPARAARDRAAVPARRHRPGALPRPLARALRAWRPAPLAYVDRPTHDYVRHDASVTVSEAEGHWVAPPSGRLGALAMRARRAARRLRLAARSPGWRSAYVGRYMLIRQLGTILDLRLGRPDPAAAPPRHRPPDGRRALAVGRALAARPLVPSLDRPQRHPLPGAGRLRRDPLAEAGGEITEPLAAHRRVTPGVP